MAADGSFIDQKALALGTLDNGALFEAVGEAKTLQHLNFHPAYVTWSIDNPPDYSVVNQVAGLLAAIGQTGSTDLSVRAEYFHASENPSDMKLERDTNDSKEMRDLIRFTVTYGDDVKTLTVPAVNFTDDTLEAIRSSENTDFRPVAEHYEERAAEMARNQDLQQARDALDSDALAGRHDYQSQAIIDKAGLNRPEIVEAALSTLHPDHMQVLKSQGRDAEEIANRLASPDRPRGQVSAESVKHIPPEVTPEQGKYAHPAL